ncbi:MAG: efflux RND transporter permease subunit [Deltaproteobacteria bacterium]|nr:MAG: efflux RND transporter permease subunit [Deltaproteobacteria bacterium]
MSAAALALRHGRAILFIAIASALGGIISAARLPKGVYPEVTFPRSQVVASLGGAPAATVLAGVTRPLEAALATVPGVEQVRSKTIRGAVELSLFFSPTTDMEKAHPLVLSRLAEARATLPPEAELVAERVLPSSFPILSINIEGPYPPEKLYQVAQYTLRPALSGLPGVGLVKVQSSDIPELEVLLDPVRAAAAHLSVPAVAEKLRAANRVQAVARLSDAHDQALGVVTGELLTADDVARVVVGGTPESPVRAGDIGRVIEGIEPRTTLIRVDGKPGVILNVSRRATGDILALDAAVRARLQELLPALPPGIELRPVYEQAKFVAGGVSAVRDAVLFGALFAVLVLAIFLRDLRATLIAALSLPLTLGASLLVLDALGETLNLMSLGGLAVAVGLVIDDAVVIVEAVHRHLEAGLAPAEAARRGTDDLLWPVVGTTLTTVVVFLPLGLLRGVAGQFFASLSIALAVAVLLSLPVALAVLPSLAARFLRPVRRPSLGRAAEQKYGALLERALGKSGAVIAAAALLVAGGAFLAWRVPTDFLPEADEGSYVVDYFAPVAAALPEADDLASRIEQVLRDTPEVANFSRRLGTELGPPVATLPSRGDIAVRLKDDRSRDVDQIMDEQRGRMAAVAPGLRIEFVQVLADMLGDLQGSPEPVEVKLFGPEVSKLRELSAQAAQRLRDIPGLVDFFNGDEGCAPEIDLRVRPAEAGRQGLQAQQIGAQLAGAFLGEVATQIRRPDYLLDVRVRFDQADLLPSTTLKEASLLTSDGRPLPVAAVAMEERQCPPAALLRFNQRNMVHLTARLSGVSLGTAVSRVRTALRGWDLPVGYTWEIGGLYQQQQDSFRALLLVLGIAVLAVAAVLLFQLRSWTRTLAVLMAAPLAMAGGAATLFITRLPLNVSSLMGAILLVGLVVKNGILLLDHALWSEEAGTPPRQALIEAGRARLRPILMTTCATLAALLPLIFGVGASSALHRPLAVVVVGGLAFSTAATLLVVPAAALALGRWRRRGDAPD